MFLQRAMRYYRVWIYCCNISLFAATIIFSLFLIWFMTDMHMALFPSVNLLHPSFIYAVIALILQGGVIQAIGCIGAVKMNEKLLTLYWNVLVVLLFGDAVVGVIWLFRYDVLVTNLRSDLKSKLNNEYGVDESFRILWDRIQSDYKCCGVNSPYDFNSTNWLSRRGMSSSTDQNDMNPFYPSLHQLVPHSCCRPPPANGRLIGFPMSTSPSASTLYATPFHSDASYSHTHGASLTASTSTSLSPDPVIGHGSHPHHHPHHHHHPSNEPTHHHGHHSTASHASILPHPPAPRPQHHTSSRSPPSSLMNDGANPLMMGSLPPIGSSHVCTSSYSPDLIYFSGCYDSILQWVQRTCDILSVLGFCVITFLKLCFTCILKYEIKEMIQKIRVLKLEEGKPGGGSSCAGGGGNSGGGGMCSSNWGNNATTRDGLSLNEMDHYIPRHSLQHETSLPEPQSPTTHPQCPLMVRNKASLKHKSNRMHGSPSGPLTLTGMPSPSSSSYVVYGSIGPSAGRTVNSFMHETATSPTGRSGKDPPPTPV